MALALQPFAAGSIIFLLVGMDISIHFDHQLCFCAVKIGNEMPNWMLAAEFMCPQVAPAQNAPQLCLSRGQWLAQLTRALPDFWADALVLFAGQLFTLTLTLSLEGRGDFALTVESGHGKSIIAPHPVLLPAGERGMAPFSLKGRRAGDEG